MKIINGRFWKSPKLMLVIAPVLLFLPGLITGKTLYWGTVALQFIPWRVLGWEQVAAGNWFPLWNPYNGVGAPLLANYQLAWFYPPSWILGVFYWLGGAPWMAWAHTLLVVLHLILAGFGLAKVLELLNVKAFGQTIGGLAFALSGYVVARTGFFSMVWAYAWLPWIVYYASKIGIPGRQIQKSSVSWLPTGLIVCIAMQLLAGHAQIAWYSLILAGLWAVAGGWSNSGAKGMLQAGLKFVLAGFAGICLSLVQLLPTAEYLLQSQRASAYDYHMALTYSFWPWRFITLIAPDFFGNPGRGDYWGYAAYWEDAVYIGILPLFLAIATLKRTIKKSELEYQGLFRFLWLFILVGFIFALGKNTPVFPFLFKNIPTFDMFQAPARYLIWVVFSLAVLAGIWANEWKRPVGRALRWLRLASAISLALILGAIAAYFILQNTVDVTSIVSVGLFGVWCLGLTLLAVRAPWRETAGDKPTTWHWLTLGWVTLDLLFAGFWLNPVIERNFYAGTDGTISPAIDGRTYMSSRDEYDLKFGRYLNFSDIRLTEAWYGARGSMLPNINILDGSASTGNFDPLLSDRYATWMEFIEGEPSPLNLMWLELMDVKRVAVYAENEIAGVEPSSLVNGQRVYWYSCVDAVENQEDALSLMADKSKTMDLARPESCVVIERPGGNSHSNPSESSDYTIHALEETYNSVQFISSTPSSGWIVLADLWYPYWSVSVDGEEAELFPANYLFRGVEVPAGQHEIRFVYRPLPFVIGGWVSLVSWIMLGIVGYFQYSKRGRIYGN